MTKPSLDTIPPFYQGYVKNSMHLEVIDALKKSNAEAVALVRSLAEDKGTFAYAEGKWTIKTLLCHMMDAERIFAYRALRFARNDKTALHGFEENDYAPEANAHGRTLGEIARQMENLRTTTVDLYTSFTPTMMERSGTANNNTLSVLALGYVIAGHEMHHVKILKERYL